MERAVQKMHADPAVRLWVHDFRTSIFRHLVLTELRTSTEPAAPNRFFGLQADLSEDSTWNQLEGLA